VAISITVQLGSQIGMPLKYVERWCERSAHGTQRDAPWDGAPQSVHRSRARRSAYRRRDWAFLTSGGRWTSRMAAQAPQ